MHVNKLCVLGGTGFVGRHLVARLASRPIELRIPTRNCERHRDLTVVPNLQLVNADLHDPDGLRNAIGDCDGVVNLIGILNEHRPGGFRKTHVELPRRLVEVCRQLGVKRLLHMSALGASADGPSDYQRSKAEGARIALAGNDPRLAVSVFQPSVIFGPGDSFLNRFAQLLRVSPGFFTLPTPNARFRPVYVNDVADAMIRALEAHAAFGQSYQLCGPREYTLRELVEYTARQVGVRRRVLGLSDGLSRLAGRVLGALPGKPYSYDNYLSASVDNLCTSDGLAALGIKPTGLEAVAPDYLPDFHRRRRYDVMHRNDRRNRR
jgi:uncharacterized protein YbjT (DUF2867 family)